MTNFRFFTIFMFVAALATMARGFEIDGQVFIVTNGGESIKLGLAKVSLYDLKTMEDALLAGKKPAAPIADYFNEESRKYRQQGDALSAEFKASDKKAAQSNDDASRAERDQVFEKFKKVTDKYFEERAFGDFPSSGLYCFQILPPALQSAKTDADGRFSFQVKEGDYALAVKATREVFGKIENYYWIVKVVSGNQPKVTVLLSNDNYSYCKPDEKKQEDVLLRDLPHDRETEVHEKMGDHDLPWLLNYMEERKKADATEVKK